MITKDRLATSVLLSEAKDVNSKSKIIMRNTRLLLCTLMQLLVMLNILSEINLLWGKIIYFGMESPLFPNFFQRILSQ